MIVRILILIEFIFPLVVQGQSLTLDDLIHIEKLSIAEVNNYLLKKNWTFLGTKDSNDGDKTTKWDFYENGDQNSNSATVDIIHQNRGDLKIISYEVANQLIYQQMTKTAKLYKMRIIGENSRDNSITSVYEGTNYNLMVEVSSERGINTHKFSLTTIKTLLGREIRQPDPIYLSLNECLAITKMNFESIKTYFNNKHFTYESDDIFHVHPDDKTNEYKIFGFVSNEKCRDNKYNCYFTFLKAAVWRGIKSKSISVNNCVFMSNDLNYLERLKMQAIKMQMTLVSKVNDEDITEATYRNSFYSVKFITDKYLKDFQMIVWKNSTKDK